MRRATVASLAAVAVVAAFACGVITIPPEPVAPVNTCTDDPSCVTLFPDAAGTSCKGGACSVDGFPAGGGPFLVVAIPRDFPGLGGVTMPLPANYATLRRTNLPPGCTNAPASVECDPIPPLTTIDTGSLQVYVGFDAVLWPPNGFRPNQPSLPNATTALPVSVTFEMLWKDPATGNYMPARKLGIVVDDVAGTVNTNTQLNGPTTSPTKHEPGFEFRATVPQPFSPDDPMSAYTMNVVPVDPFGVVPPFVRGRSLGLNTYKDPLTNPIIQPGLGPIGISLFNAIPFYTTSAEAGAPVQAHNYEVDEDPGAVSLEGWVLHIDDADGRRLSGNLVLGAGPKKFVTAYEATGVPSQTGETLFIDPPPGVDMPRYTSPSFANQIVGPFTYPALPPAVTLQGKVQTTDPIPQPASARITFVANGNANYVVQADGTTPAQFLAYKKLVSTLPGEESVGQYSVSVPPGNLRVYVVPDDETLAITVTDTLVGTDPVQKGKGLPVRHRSHVKGRVVLSNGTPVFAADVLISPSADSAFTPNDDPLARPRDSRGATDVNGVFDVLADPGLVDISIRPRDGTKYPWKVITNRVVPISDGADGGGQLTLNIADVVLPAPSRYTQSQPSGELTDSTGIPIPRAVLRAYAFPPLGSAADGGPPGTRAARLIGMTTTDANALFQLFLAPPE